MQVGELVARGRTSSVYLYGRDSVAKVPNPEVPEAWPRFEAELTQAVWSTGIPAPEVRDVITVDGRTSVVFARVHGPSMWQQMIDEPANAATLARDLAAVQKDLQSVAIPDSVPDLVDRLTRKIRQAPGLTATDVSDAVEITQSLPRGAALLHGDLHPGNILMSADGPVVIDWFDAAIGHPIADVVRSSILMRPGAAEAPRHLPQARSELLRAVHDEYLLSFRSELRYATDDLPRWQAVIAAGRLSEGAELNEQGLLALWDGRHDRQALQLVPESASSGL